MPETIFAPATAPGRAGIAVVRLSGPAVRHVLAATAGALPEPRRAALRAVRDPATGDVLDRGLVLWFPAPGSFTGEDAGEFHLHGAPSVLAAVSRVLAGFAGVRPAEPGEFTRRAFDAGRLDLTAVEGLADLVAADTEAQRRQAVFALGGGLAAAFDGWRERLAEALAHTEAAIDFSDEELPGDLEARTAAGVADVLEEMRRARSESGRGEVVRSGFRVALVGAPNAGKSSLLNALAEREVAIVSDTAGTTRDVLEVRLDIGGHLVRILDMAGLREGGGPIEREGMRRALAEAGGADLRLLMTAPDAGPPPAMPGLAVASKCDIRRGSGLNISVRTGEGLDALVGEIAAAVRERTAGDVPASAVRARHARALGEACAALERFVAAGQADLAAEDLRLAVRALGRVTGRVDVEDLLDTVFRDFCIGK